MSLAKEEVTVIVDLVIYCYCRHSRIVFKQCIYTSMFSIKLTCTIEWNSVCVGHQINFTDFR